MKPSFPRIAFGRSWLCLAWGFLGAVRLLAQSSPSLLPLQFRATDSNGVAVSDGVCTVTFRIYTNAVAGAASWVETHRDVGVRAGVAGVMLGSINGTITNLDFAEVQYLGIAVESASGSGAAVETVPRTVLLPTIRATVAERARSFPGGSIGTVELARADVPAAAMAPGTSIANLQGVPEDRLAVGAMARNIFRKGYFGDGTVLMAGNSTNKALLSLGCLILGELGGIWFYESPTPGFRFVPGGRFQMGRVAGDTDADAPPSLVTVSVFQIQAFEVTKAQWDEVRAWAVTHGYTDLSEGVGKRADHPVVNLSWFDCIKWCNAWSERDGLAPVYRVGGEVMRTGVEKPDADWRANGYRLPTEAEWEMAARGGSERRFFLGESISHLDANFKDVPLGGSDPEYHPRYSADGVPPFTSPVGSFQPNGYRLYDTIGNAWEWCWDWYRDDYYYESVGETNPRGPDEGSARVLRGGSWYDSESYCRSSTRVQVPPEGVSNNFGFRPARNRP